jgi:hypothetical protein
MKLAWKTFRRGFYETAGGVKRFLFFPSLEVFVFAFAFAFAFVLVCQIHLGLLYALIVSRFGSVPVGTRW